MKEKTSKVLGLTARDATETAQIRAMCLRILARAAGEPELKGTDEELVWAFEQELMMREF